MTQQSLITRLKAVEEALEEARGNINPERGFADELEQQIEAALSDLRELIKEAEGQTAYYGTVLLNGTFQHRTTYTALGEKP